MITLAGWVAVLGSLFRMFAPAPYLFPFGQGGAAGVLDRWYVRKFSTGELVSHLFILRKRVAWVLPNPRLGRLLAEDALSQLTRRDSFIKLLIAD
jgi:hypothetical protein